MYSRLHKKYLNNPSLGINLCLSMKTTIKQNIQNIMYTLFNIKYEFISIRLNIMNLQCFPSQLQKVTHKE